MERPYKIIFLMIILEITATYPVADAENKYCHIRTCQEPVPILHTGCIFKINKLGATCTDLYQIISNNLNDSEKIDIVRRHNEIRQYVAAGKEQRGSPGPQPAAMFMRNLTWDNELARLAQTWANQCLDYDYVCHDVARFQVQSYGITYISNDTNALPSVVKIINDWYDEVDYFDPNSSLRYYADDEDTLHYTQMVWARTRKIGCGQITIGKLPTSNKTFDYILDGNSYAKIFYCNYGPAGNVEERKVYRRVRRVNELK